MRYDDLEYMPKTRFVLGDKGMTFQNAFVSTPLCCPSRATIMRGQYAHNTGVWHIANPNGGWQTYRAKGLERDNVATRLDAAGYATALFGKYLNGYSGTTNKPPGWDKWFAHTGKPGMQHPPRATSTRLTDSRPRALLPLTSKTSQTSPLGYESCRGSAMPKRRR